MYKLIHLAATLVAAVPLIAGAQTPSVTPAGQPRTDLEKQQTTQTGNAQKYGTTGTDTGASTATGTADGTTASAPRSKRKMKADAAKGNKTAPGDAPTYPAPAPDGTPTK